MAKSKLSRNFQVTQDSSNTSNEDTMSPSKLEYQKIMNENLNRPDLNNVRIMAYQGMIPQAPEGSSNSLRVIYTQNKTPGSTRKPTRHIPQTADRVLDAPDIMDDYCESFSNGRSLRPFTRDVVRSLSLSLFRFESPRLELQQLLGGRLVRPSVFVEREHRRDKPPVRTRAKRRVRIVRFMDQGRQHDSSRNEHRRGASVGRRAFQEATRHQGTLCTRRLVIVERPHTIQVSIPRSRIWPPCPWHFYFVHGKAGSLWLRRSLSRCL